jgi:hypothetical protein
VSLWPGASESTVQRLQRAPWLYRRTREPLGWRYPVGLELQRPAGLELQRPVGLELQRPVGLELQRPAGLELQRPVGLELQRGSNSPLQHVHNRVFTASPVSLHRFRGSVLSPQPDHHFEWSSISTSLQLDYAT